jgi:hypothetical protein
MRSVLFFACVLVAGCSSPSTGADAGPLPDTGHDAGVRVPVSHRASADACSTTRGPGTADPTLTGGECTTDAQCTMGTNGRCMLNGLGARFDFCSYDDCASDADCMTNEVCRCRESASDSNACVQGDCHTDADCGPGGFCSPSRGYDRINLGVTGFFCHMPADTCVDDSDCAGDAGQGACVWFPDMGHWACSWQGFFPP